MKAIASLSMILCVALLDVACGARVFYLRTPMLDTAEVHTERIGGSFAYKTTELLAYSPIVFNYNVPFTINYQHPLSVLVGVQSKPALKPLPEVPAPTTDEPIHDSVVTLDDDDTVAVEAAT